MAAVDDCGGPTRYCGDIIIAIAKRLRSQDIKIRAQSSTDLGSDMSEVWSALLRKHLSRMGAELQSQCWGLPGVDA